MVDRGLATEEEALRTVVREAVQAINASEASRQRKQALAEAYGSWAGEDDLPRKEDGSLDWGAIKDEIYEGMP